MPITIKLSTLKRMGACIVQQLRFEKAFGKEVVVTHARAQMYAIEFDWQWAANHLLPRKARMEWRDATMDAGEQYDTTWWKIADEYHEGKMPWTRRMQLEHAAFVIYRQAQAREFVRAYRKHKKGKKP